MTGGDIHRNNSWNELKKWAKKLSSDFFGEKRQVWNLFQGLRNKVRWWGWMDRLWWGLKVVSVMTKRKLIIFSYGKLVTYMNDGTSLKSVRQIRRTEYPEYNLGNTRTAKLIIYLALLVKHHKCFQFPYFVPLNQLSDS